MVVSLNIDYNSGSYAYSTECEIFPSIKKAKDAFWCESDSERIADGSQFLGYLYIGSFADCTDMLPDYELTVGKRGGIHCVKSF